MKTLLVVLQDNPDPDAIAAGAALRVLANALCGATCSIAHGGIIGRAENRALAKYLALNLRGMSELNPATFDGVALVDTQPGTGNNSLPDEAPVDIIIDHHPFRHVSRRAAFTDIRRLYGATSTILFEYLRAANVPMDPPLATALLYGIRSDTQDLGRQATKADIEAHTFLYAVANPRMLGYITHSGLPDDYFQFLHTGLLNARRYGAGIVTNLGDVEHPDMIAEVADLLLRNDNAHWSLAMGAWQGVLYLSLRAEDPDGRAGRVMRRIAAGLGAGGGHDMMAGGEIPLAGRESAAARRRLADILLRRFLKAIHEADTRGQPLVRTP